MTGSVKRWGNRMPCEVQELPFCEGPPWRCGTLTIFTKPDASGVHRRICRAHIEEQRERGGPGMSAQLVQAPDSKVWHIGVHVDGTSWLPLCNINTDIGLWRLSLSSKWPDITWRTPHGICSNCSKQVESAVRLIAAEESRND